MRQISCWTVCWTFYWTLIRSEERFTKTTSLNVRISASGTAHTCNGDDSDCRFTEGSRGFESLGRFTRFPLPPRNSSSSSGGKESPPEGALSDPLRGQMDARKTGSNPRPPARETRTKACNRAHPEDDPHRPSHGRGPRLDPLRAHQQNQRLR